jgi:hypothetical protein
MLIELWRKETAEDYSVTPCAICGNDFELGSVYPVVGGDRGQELGEMCPVCLDYLNRRKEDTEDSTAGNWPAREWPTLGDLEDARRRYPDPLFETRGDLVAAAVDFEADEKITRETIIWSMERETV